MMSKPFRYALATFCFAASFGCLALWGWTFTLSDFGRSLIFPLWYPALVFALGGVGVIRCKRQFTLRAAFIVTTVFVVLAGMFARIVDMGHLGP